MSIPCKKVFTSLLILASLFKMYASKPATIIFKDGHTESGYVKSFLETRIVDLSLFPSVERSLHLDDKVIKFSITEADEPIKISIDDIDEITVTEKYGAVIYKVLNIKDVSPRGNLVDTGEKVFLPLVRRGKVNLYGFVYYERDISNRGFSVYEEYRFYYQNAKEDYAISYLNDLGIEDVFHIMEMLDKPLEVLYSDCPELVAKVHSLFIDTKNLPKEERKKVKDSVRAKNKAMRKAFKELPAEIRENDLYAYFKYNYVVFEELLTEYNQKCNP